MTMALCFHCGNTKFGALCPCPSCTLGATGNMNLDIHFSDHHYTVETLRAFGEVIRAINRVCDDKTDAFWSFIYYLKTKCPGILDVKVAPDNEERYAAILTRASPPTVNIVKNEGPESLDLEKRSDKPLKTGWWSKKREV